MRILMHYNICQLQLFWWSSLAHCSGLSLYPLSSFWSKEWRVLRLLTDWAEMNNVRCLCSLLQSGFRSKFEHILLFHALFTFLYLCSCFHSGCYPVSAWPALTCGDTVTIVVGSWAPIVWHTARENRELPGRAWQRELTPAARWAAQSRQYSWGTHAHHKKGTPYYVIYQYIVCWDIFNFAECIDA